MLILLLLLLRTSIKAPYQWIATFVVTSRFATFIWIRTWPSWHPFLHSKRKDFKKKMIRFLSNKRSTEMSHYWLQLKIPMLYYLFIPKIGHLRHPLPQHGSTRAKIDIWVRAKSTVIFYALACDFFVLYAPLLERQWEVRLPKDQPLKATTGGQYWVEVTARSVLVHKDLEA